MWTASHLLWTHPFPVISRQFIPRFFRSIFDSGMRELSYVLQGPSRECTLPNGHPAYENERVLQVTKYENANHSEVQTEGKLYIEFTPFDEQFNYRIKAWTLELRRSEEYVYNHITKVSFQTLINNFEKGSKFPRVLFPWDEALQFGPKTRQPCNELHYKSVAEHESLEKPPACFAFFCLRRQLNKKNTKRVILLVSISSGDKWNRTLFGNMKKIRIILVYRSTG